MGARFAWNNLLLASGVTITASGEVSDRPAAYLASAARWKKWRSTATSGDQWVTFDLGSNRVMQAFLLCDWRSHPGGTIRAQANATDVWTAPTVNALFTLPAVGSNPTGVIAVWLSAPVSVRFVRFYFTNTAHVSDYVELGVAFAGSYFEPVGSVSPEVPMSRVDPSIRVAAVGGQASTQMRQKFFSGSALLEVTTTTEKDAWLTMFEAIGIGVPLFLAIDPAVANLLFYAYLTTPQAFSPFVDVSTWNIPFQFEEAR